MKPSEVLKDRPAGWGMSGDPYFWDYLEEKAAGMEPLSPDELEKWIRDEYFALSREMMEPGSAAYVERFAHGGTSSGAVSGSWWIGSGIPLLRQRLRGVLVTGFEPFGGEKMNPTEAVLGMLPSAVGSCAIRKLLLPVEFQRSRELAFAGYDEAEPCAVVMLGQAGGRGSITPETAGKNVMNGRIPDNAGYEPRGVPVAEDGPEKLYSTANVDKIVAAVRAEGVPCDRSDDAGEYVCNALLYGMLEHNGGAVPTVFIHVPFVREQGHSDKPFMELRDVCRAVLAAVRSVTEDVTERFTG